MKTIIAVLCLGVVLATAVNVPALDEYLIYCKTYGKVYTEEGHSAYTTNMERIRAHNADPNKNFTMGVNHFTDMTDKDISMWLGEYSDTRFDDTPILTLDDLPQAPPDTWDWRQHGAVNPIKDQKSCGVCWAFASTSAVESAFFIDQKKLISLSESQQADCDTSGGCNECAFKWLQSHQPCTEDSFPYQCPDNRGCKSCSAGASVIRSFAVVQQSNEVALKAAVFDRPVAIGIAASGDFMSYRSGVFTGSCPGGRNHAVVLVGYGSANGVDYWILRNSWGTGWGEGGYMRIARGRNGADGICLLATDPSVPYFNK